MTIADQLRLFQALTIVVPPCGETSLLFSFLPAKATLIVSGFPEPDKIGHRNPASHDLPTCRVHYELIQYDRTALSYDEKA